MGVVHIFGSSGCNAASPPIEEVGPAPVFEAAFDGEQGVGARLRPAGIRMAELRVPCLACHDARRPPFAGLRKPPRDRPMLNPDAPDCNPPKRRQSDRKRKRKTDSTQKYKPHPPPSMDRGSTRGNAKDRMRAAAANHLIASRNCSISSSEVAQLQTSLADRSSAPSPSSDWLNGQR